MSFRAVTWAFDRVRGLSATEKLVLLALAEFANDDNETWRSREMLAQRAECSTKTVQRTVRSLREAGLIEIQGRWAWCGSDAEECASRPSHKHRSGTTYKLRLDRSGDVRELRSVDAEISTEDKLSPMEKALESRGKVHRRQFVPYGAIPDTQGLPRGTPVAPIWSVNPQLNPQTRPDLATTEAVGSVGDDSSVMVAAPDGARPPATAGDAQVVAQCLPGHLRNLDAHGLTVVAGLLRERLVAGWSAKAIRDLMDQPVPERVGRLAGLVAYRLQQNVLPELAPRKAPPPQRPPVAVAVEPERDPVSASWGALVWEPAFEAAAAASGSYLHAYQATLARLERDGLDQAAFRAAWSELAHVPASERGQAALTLLLPPADPLGELRPSSRVGVAQ